MRTMRYLLQPARDHAWAEPARWHKPRFRTCSALLIGLTAYLSACSLEDTVDVDDGTDEGIAVDQSVLQSYAGARGLYYNAIKQAAQGIEDYTFASAILTDELQKRSSSAGSAYLYLDVRQNLTAGSSDLQPIALGEWFASLSSARVRIQHARGALQRHPTLAPPVYAGELHALQGLVEVLLAEGFCSGIPLTSVPYDGPFQYSAGLSTTEILHHAIAQFDSALLYGSDSVAVASLARVGKGRALLGLGEYAAAATVVAPVPNDAIYLLYYAAIEGNSTGHWGEPNSSNVSSARIGNREGGNGLVWYPPGNAATVLQRKDPRIPLTATGGNSLAPTVLQAKYTSGTTTQVLASGLEARLVQAEADLRAGGTQWLTLLNTLRTNGTFTIVGTDTIWGLGTGQIRGGPLGDVVLQTRGVRPLADPGTSTAKIDSLFQDRAFWLYLTGHRQGDLRRLARPVEQGGYGRAIEQVFPWGQYVYPGNALIYGRTVVLTPPPEEQQHNARYKGCVHIDP